MPFSAKPDPTPEEIAERVAEVQARWSEAERENHRANVAERNAGVVPWELPIVSVSGGEVPGVTPDYVRAIETSTAVDSR